MTTSSLNFAIPSLAASFPAYPDLGDNISFIVVGFVFVIVVLLALAAMTSLIGAGITRTSKAPEPKPPPTAAPVAPAARAPSSVEAELFAGHSNPEHVPAILAAAVHAVLQGRKHRIKGVRITSGRWAQEGRRDIFSSHRVR